MKILHAIQDLPPTAGTTVFCEAVASCQREFGHDVSIVEKKTYARQAIREADVVHMHGIWSPFNVRVMLDCLLAGVPYVVSLHGCIMPRVFTRGRIKKQLFLRIFVKPLLRRAAAIHCTSSVEQNVCIVRNLPGPFVIAPLGVYMPEEKVKAKGEGEQRMILFLGRLGKEKGLVNLLDAWKSIDHAGWVLKIAGPDWLDYKKILDDKIAAENIQGVEFPGLVQGEAKDALYREADIFVLPSPMENFSMVVLEALVYGVPAIATKGTPWAKLETEHCGWWIDQGVGPLREALQNGMSLTDDERARLGANGRALAERKYQWPVICNTIVNFYKGILALK